MSTIMPGTELARKALQWISESRSSCGQNAKPGEIRKLLDEAAMRFNLSPLDVEFLERTLVDCTTKEP